MIGIDEAGRGAWAGPLVAAGCMFNGMPTYKSDLNDSKVLARKKREQLYELIIESCSYHVAVIEPHIVDEIGLTAALKQAAAEIANALPNSEPIIIDGNYNFLGGTEHANRVNTVIKADASVPEVMAASILAKVTRDKIMQELDIKYSGYGFSHNVGYGTVQHSNALKQLGVTKVHRHSYRPVAAVITDGIASNRES